MTGNPARSIVCPSCGKLIGSDEKRCPWCDAGMPGFLGGQSQLAGLFGDTLELVVTIPIFCVVLYVVSLALDPAAAMGTGSLGSFLAPSFQSMGTLGMTGGVAPWWTTITAIYLHGGLLHIVFNVMWLRQLGPEVDRAFGGAAFFVIFTVSGVVGFLVSNILSGTPTIGASGSIFGLLAALIVFGRQLGGTLGSAMSAKLWQWAIILFIFGFIMRGVNNYAHLGGFIGGWVAATVIGKVRPSVQGENRGVQLAALTCLVLTVFAFGNVAWRLIRSI